MKFNKKSISFMILAASVLICILCYNLIYTKNIEKADALEADIKVLAARESQLKGYVTKLPEYKQGIEREKATQDTIIAKFPNDIKQEDEIMFANDLENTHEIFFQSLSFGSFKTFSSFADEIIETNFEGKEITLSCTYQCTYQGLKDTINYVNGQNNRMIINNLSAAYDPTTGLLSGTIDITMYAIDGVGNTYKQPYIPDMSIGVTNIFGTIE